MTELGNEYSSEPEFVVVYGSLEHYLEIDLKGVFEMRNVLRGFLASPESVLGRNPSQEAIDMLTAKFDDSALERDEILQAQEKLSQGDKSAALSHLRKKMLEHSTRGKWAKINGDETEALYHEQELTKLKILYNAYKEEEEAA